METCTVHSYASALLRHQGHSVWHIPVMLFHQNARPVLRDRSNRQWRCGPWPVAKTTLDACTTAFSSYVSRSTCVRGADMYITGGSCERAVRRVGLLDLSAGREELVVHRVCARFVSIPTSCLVMTFRGSTRTGDSTGAPIAPRLSDEPRVEFDMMKCRALVDRQGALQQLNAKMATVYYILWDRYLMAAASDVGCMKYIHSVSYKLMIRSIIDVHTAVGTGV